MNVQIYFQTQFHDQDNLNRHSDGCGPADEDMRKFFHDLLDEWLNAQKEGSSTDQDENSLLFKVCSCH